MRWRATCYTLFGSWWPEALNYNCGLTGTHAVTKRNSYIMLWSLAGGMVVKTGVTGLVEVTALGEILRM